MKGKYADIIVDISHEKVDRPFQYKIPEEFLDKLEIGMAVKIPFGAGNKLITGYIMNITDAAVYDKTRLKYIAEVIQDGVKAESNMICLAWWMKEHYGSTMITALKTVLPVKKQLKSLEKKRVLLLLTTEEAGRLLRECETKHKTARARLLKELIVHRELPYTLVTQKLNVTAQTIKALEELGVVQTVSESYYRSTLPKNVKDGEAKKLTKEQQNIVDIMIEDYNAGMPDTYLLRGVTGSGKTEVYMSLIEKMTAKGKQSIVLIPEIALTYQTVMRFYEKFGDRVSVVNSRLSPGEKSDQFKRAANGEIDIMIGPRSALFTPFVKLGLIIIDEEHENSYKSESMPKYHARETAITLAAYHGASVLLGSATPSVTSYYRAKQGKYRLLTLTERVKNSVLPKVYIEDLRKELKEGNRSIFSRRLQAMIEDRLEKKEQIMLFLNRRGYAGFVSCRACGHVMKCPHCDISLSEHKNSTLVCHYCGYTTKSVTTCPACGSKYILGFKAGTQQVEEMVRNMFPSASILRMDADTTKSKDGYETILSAFANREADILIGTQMIVKGHDFPYVTLVGILAADLSLHAGDYRAGEKTFQLLTQAAGRAGRGGIKGEVVIQTYQPENYSVIHAANQDYESFYEEEIIYREIMNYPPAAHMLAILVTSQSEEAGKVLAENIASLLKQNITDRHLIIIGPAAAAVSKISDIYRHVIYLKHKEYGVLVEAKEVVENYVECAKLKKETLQFDFDPMSAY